MLRLKIEQSKGPLTTKNFDLLVVVLPEKNAEKTLTGHKALSSSLKNKIRDFAKSRKFKFDKGAHLFFDSDAELSIGVLVQGSKVTTFEALTSARKLVGNTPAGMKKICVDVSALEEDAQLTAIDTLTSACKVAWDYTKPQYVKKAEKAENPTHVTFYGKSTSSAKKQLTESQTLADATNLARHLYQEPANKLGCKELANRAKKLAKDLGVKFQFINKSKLEQFGAGAFLAVARGSAHQDAGIAKLTYRPTTAKKDTPKIAIVGKGVVYDTGGTNLKPAQYMFGMQGDMGGSAIALSLTQAIVQLKLPVEVNCYLAISDNAIGENAYRPNEVVTTISGKTIETVHTDAEGRMMLVDTLEIAKKDGYDMVMDFATLTGSCVAAIGTTYSGVFCNKTEWVEKLIEAGRKSGERVWPFPLDEDFGTPLKSEVADLKQCLLKGGVDHIEAAKLLQNFVDPKKPWVHMDLSACENEGGLAHVPTSVTGFGVRVGMKILRDTMKV